MAPRHMRDDMFVHLDSSGSGANEKAVMAAYHHKYGHDISRMNLDDVLHNKGSPLNMVSFQGHFHGRTMGALSLTRSNPLHKATFPAFPWLMSPFPQLKYPLRDHEEHNRGEESRCLEAFRNILKNNDVAGVIAEPIPGEGGDIEVSNGFFREMFRITREFNVTLIVDEVQTGMGATGKFWAHEHWGEDVQPDIVTWGKKFQTGGFHARPE